MTHVPAHTAEETSLQSLFVPDGICYGCGPRNLQGLGLRSYLIDRDVVAEWQPQPQHAAFPDILCGGVIGTLIDCHSGAALARAVHEAEGRWPWAESAGWATAAYSVQLQRPTPLSAPVHLIGKVMSLNGDDASIAVELHSAGKLRATGNAAWRRLSARPTVA